MVTPTNKIVCEEAFDRKFPEVLRFGKGVSMRGGAYLHKHPNFSEIMYIESGSGLFCIEDRKYPIEKGDIIVINHDTLHSFEISDEDVIFDSLCITNIYLKGLPVNDIIPHIMEPVIKSSDKSKFIVELVLRVIDEVQNEEPGYAPIAGGLLMAIFAYIRRNFVSKQTLKSKTSSKDLAKTIKEYICQNFRKELSLESIAEAFYISTYYLSHLMKDEYDISPIQYIMQLRIGEAQNLLGNTDLTVTDISYSVGYKNISYFNILFKRHVGMTPVEYRNKHKTKACVTTNPDNWVVFLNDKK